MHKEALRLSSKDRVPTSAIESHYRLVNIMLGGKLKADQHALDAGNAYLDAMERIHRLVSGENRSPLSAAIEEEYQKALTRHHVRVEFLHVGRQPFEYEHISRDFDYSPRYIERLIAQGAESASNAVEDYLERKRSGREPGMATAHPPDVRHRAEIR